MGRRRKCDIPSPSSDLDCGSDDNDIKVVARTLSANARERQRMRVLSKAFVKLKTTLPWVPPDTKLSKLDTLKLATCYISHLKQLLEEDEAALSGSGSLSGGPGEGLTSADRPSCARRPETVAALAAQSAVTPVATRKGSPPRVHPLNLVRTYSTQDWCLVAVNLHDSKLTLVILHTCAT